MSELKVGSTVHAFLYVNGEPIEDDTPKTFIIGKNDTWEKNEVNGLTYIMHEGKEYELYKLV